MKRLIGIMIVLVLNTFAAAAQNAPEIVMPLVYVTVAADDQNGSPDFDLYAMNPQTGETLFNSTSPMPECHLTVSPDGQWLFYRQPVMENEDLKLTYPLVNLKTGTPHQIDLGQDDLRISNAMWGADANNFYFFVYKQGDNRIYQYNLATNSAAEIISSEQIINLMRLGRGVIYWSWSADDKVLTLHDLRGNAFEIQLQLTEFFTPGPASPDGQFVVQKVAATGQDQNEQIDFILSSIDGFSPVTISDAYKGTNLAWRADSQAVFYYGMDHNFIVYDLARQQKLLFPVPRDMASIERMQVNGYWSPDGRYILYTVDYGAEINYHNQIELGLIDTSTGEISQVASYNDVNARRAGFIQWIDNRQFAYFSGIPGYDSDLLHTASADIIKYDVVTRTFTNLTNTPDLIELANCWYG